MLMKCGGCGETHDEWWFLATIDDVIMTYDEVGGHFIDFSEQDNRPRVREPDSVICTWCNHEQEVGR